MLVKVATGLNKTGTVNSFCMHQMMKCNCSFYVFSPLFICTRFIKIKELLTTVTSSVIARSLQFIANNNKI